MKLMSDGCILDTCDDRSYREGCVFCYACLDICGGVGFMVSDLVLGVHY